MIYLRSPGTNYCDITAASNTTPIRLTVARACGLNEGDTIVVVDVRGNTAANIHLDKPGETANLARKVAGLAGNSFNLMDLEGRPVSGAIHPSCSGPPTTHLGTCRYTGGGRAGLATAHRLRPHPVLFFDGPNGPRTTGLLDRAGKANPSQTAVQAIARLATEYTSRYNRQWGAEHFNGGGETQGIGVYTLATALHWKLTGDEASARAAIFSLGENPDQVLGTPACVESDMNCAAPASLIMDYPMQFSQSYYQAFSLLRDSLSAEQRSRFTGFFLSDQPWSQGGIGYTGVVLNRPAYTKSALVAGGTVRLKLGSREVAGSGTSFTRQCSAGGILVSNKDVYGHAYRIVSIESDTSLTVDGPVVENNDRANFSCGPRWNPSLYGFLWHQKHMNFHPLNGGTLGQEAEGHPSPYYGAFSGAGADGYNNHSLVRTMGMFGLGLATCRDDERGCLLAAQADEWLNDIAMPYAMTLWTGFSWAGNTYHEGRILSPVLRWAGWRRNSLEQAPDPLAGTDIREKAAHWAPWSQVPLWNHLPNAENAWLGPTVLNLGGSLEAMAFDPEAAHSRHLQWWFLNGKWYNPSGGHDSTRFGYGEQSINLAGGVAASEVFLIYDPAVASEPIVETTAHFTQNNLAACQERFGAEHCRAQDVRRVSISRSDWTDTATYVAVNSTGRGCRDHCADDLGGYFYIFKNQQPLLATDTDNLMGSLVHRGYPVVGSMANFELDGYFGTPTPWTEAAATLMFVRTDLTAIYKPAAHVNSMERQILHLKGAGTPDFVIDHVRGEFSSPQSFAGLQHYNLNGCGTPADTKCVQLDPAKLEAAHVHNDGVASARLNSRVVGMNGSAVGIGTASGNPANGSYPEGQGSSFRWQVSPAQGAKVTSIEYAVIHQPSSDPTTVLPPLEASLNGIFRQIEIHHPKAPRVLAFTARGATAAGLTIKSTHAGQGYYAVIGLVPGIYQVCRENGDPVAGPLTVKAPSHTVTFTSTAGVLTVKRQTPGGKTE